MHRAHNIVFFSSTIFIYIIFQSSLLFLFCYQTFRHDNERVSELRVAVIRKTSLTNKKSCAFFN